MILYLHFDILNHILHNYLDLDSYINLIKTCKSINESKSNVIKEKFVTIQLQKYINTNYVKFNKLISLISKSNLDEVFKLCLFKIETIWENQQNGRYDLRFIFECLYNGCKIKNKSDYFECNNLNYIKYCHFYNHFYQDIVNCIVENNKVLTLKKINNCPKLKSLHSDYKPCNKYKNDNYFINILNN
jgi:hypothetical protein